MKKLFLTILIFMSFILQAQGKVKIVATLPVFGSIAQEIGGERVEVTSLASADQDPHFIDAKPSYAVLLNQADLLIEGNMGLETGWLPPLLLQARNPKIMKGGKGYVDASQGVESLEIPQGGVNLFQGDIHPRGNPHQWFDPRAVKILAVNINQHLVAIDAEGKPYYDAQLKNFIDQLNQHLSQWAQLTQGWRGKKIITYHRSLSYLAHWLGLEVRDTLEPKPGIPPSTRRIEELVKTLQNDKISLLLSEEFYPRSLADYLAQNMKVPLLVIKAQPHAKQKYVDWMDSLLNQMQKKIL
ncbi:MAG: zinc ABC transporter substrate-binding protein [Deltaproteobacteria bacterium]|nr:zinc ABC transporter substrate-binding protein [Deltaproteobacteria bacterium]